MSSWLRLASLVPGPDRLGEYQIWARSRTHEMIKHIGAKAGNSQWLRLSRRYLAAIAAGHLVWETMQLPLYTIWWEGGSREIAFAVIHCTGGDVLIGAMALAVAIPTFGRSNGPDGSFLRVAVAAVLLGVGYTAFSEWYNTRVDGSWAYSPLMPLVPPFGLGLSPLLQWIVIPWIAFWRLRPRKPATDADLPSASSREPR